MSEQSVGTRILALFEAGIISQELMIEIRERFGTKVLLSNADTKINLLSTDVCHQLFECFPHTFRGETIEPPKEIQTAAYLAAQRVGIQEPNRSKQLIQLYMIKISIRIENLGIEEFTRHHVHIQL